MYRYLPIRDIYAREITDSRGNPAFEAEVLAGEDIVGRASVSAGILAEGYEAARSRDWKNGNMERTMEQAVEYVNAELAQAILGLDVFDQAELDKVLSKSACNFDKRNLRVNTILGISMAAARTAATALKLPLYRYLGGMRTKRMPIPMFSILDGGIYAENTFDIQEVLLIPGKTKNYREGFCICTKVYQSLKEILKEKTDVVRTGVAGGFAPDLTDVKEALELTEEAVKRAGCQMKQDISIVLHTAASRLYNADRKVYDFPGESKRKGQKIIRSTEEWLSYYEELAERFPIDLIEEPLGNNDREGWEKIEERLGGKVQLAADVPCTEDIQNSAKEGQVKTVDTVVLNLAQMGTLSEALDVSESARKAGKQTILSCRCGGTEDTMLADAAVAFRTDYIKVGAPWGTERTAQYNQLLRIEEDMGF
ncbi:phosphopyruvate hydratase [Mediterraneibacter massiliensis]|uniref:phosphopyruvate hydratase n=1 Tax=Mediterraneibacter massiliensis TaxID=1720300 RepID=UPI000E54194D|nr:phosphopyruvate hydratase [Mediterraneibacter massiliensis]RGT71989.1 phosphopyruvate hydratase [Ruminococcus sp. AF18-22]